MKNLKTARGNNGEGKGNPLQCSCLENPRDRRAWWAAVYVVAQSWTPNEHSALISFRIDWFDLLTILGTLKSLLQHQSLQETLKSLLQHQSFQVT